MRGDLKIAFALLRVIANDYTGLDSEVQVVVVPAAPDVTPHQISDVPEPDQAVASLENSVMSKRVLLRLCCQANLLKILQEQNSLAILTWF
jgi:hypothetical protein